MDQQELQIGQPILQEQLTLQAYLIQQVDPESERKIEIHEIDSDLEEETGNATSPFNIFTSRTSYVPFSEFLGDIFHALFSPSSFSHVDLNPIVEENCRDQLVSKEFPSDTPPPSPCVSSIPHASEPPTTYLGIPFSQVENHSIYNIPYQVEKLYSSFFHFPHIYILSFSVGNFSS